MLKMRGHGEEHHRPMTRVYEHANTTTNAEHDPLIMHEIARLRDDRQHRLLTTSLTLPKLEVSKKTPILNKQVLLAISDVVKQTRVCKITSGSTCNGTYDAHIEDNDA